MEYGLPVSPYLHLFVDEFPVLVALQKISLILTMRIATIFLIIINIVKIMIFTYYLEYIGGSSVLPSYGRVNVSRQTSPVCGDPVGNIKTLLLEGLPP